MPMPKVHQDDRSVPRAFQAFLVAYVLVTGELVEGLQAAIFGLQGGGDGFFTLATLIAIATDLLRVAPVLYFARHPLGVLHPLILATVLWPLLVAMPRTIEELGGLGGILLGEQVAPPFYSGLGWLPGPEIWRAEAWAHLCELIALLSIFAGYALVHERRLSAPASTGPQLKREFDGQRLRALAIVLVGISVAGLLVLISMRGGLAQHLVDMSRGRFRSMAGLGPLIALVDLGLVALIVWVAARPEDVKKPMLPILMLGVTVAQFLSNGARGSAFSVFILVGLAWALRTRRIPWRVALLLVPLFFIAFGALNIIRTAGFTGQSAVEAIEDNDTSDALSRAQEEIELRRSMQSTVPVIWAGHELMGGPLMGGSYAAAVLAGVPRKIWPDKPRGPGSLYAQSFLGEVREGFAVPVNAVAEEYWNFGLLGVILISALYGACIRYAHNLFMTHQESPFYLAGFVIFVTTFRPSTDDLVLFQQQMALLLFVFLLALIFAIRRRTAAIHSPLAPAQLSWSQQHLQR